MTITPKLKVQLCVYVISLHDKHLTDCLKIDFKTNATLRIRDNNVVTVYVSDCLKLPP